VEDLARRGELTTPEMGGRAPRFARVLSELEVPKDEALLDRMADLYTRGRLEAARLFPGAVEALTALGEVYAIGLITEGDGANQRAQLERLGIADRFDHVVISHEAGIHKPDTALYGYALDRAGLSPAEAVMVGDRIDWDLLPAASLGMLTVLFTHKNMYLGLRRELSFEPDWTVRDYAELIEVLLPA
jgi:HAD superfamily hydrolase (TIGR01549 family)